VNIRSKKNKENRVKYLLILLVFLFVVGFYGTKEYKQRKMFTYKNIIHIKDADIKTVIILSENNTYGYDIYVYGTVLVHHPSRPGLPGNTGFSTEEDAGKVAKLIIKKISNNEMPPTITIEELRELGC